MEQHNLAKAVAIVTKEMIRRCGVLDQAADISESIENQAYLKGQKDALSWAMNALSAELGKK